MEIQGYGGIIPSGGGTPSDTTAPSIRNNTPSIMANRPEIQCNLALALYPANAPVRTWNAKNRSAKASSICPVRPASTVTNRKYIPE